MFGYFRMKSSVVFFILPRCHNITDFICNYIKWFIMISMYVCAEENMDSLLLA